MFTGCPPRARPSNNSILQAYCPWDSRFRVIARVPSPSSKPAIPLCPWRCGWPFPLTINQKKNIHMKAQIELPVPELKNALAGLSKVICKSSSLPVLHSIRVSKDVTGVITLQATDLESVVTYRAESEGVSAPPIELLVPYDHLAKTVKGASPKDRIGLARENKDRVCIHSLVSNTPIEEVIEACPLTDWPPSPPVTGAPMPLTDEFKTALRC